MNYFLEGLDYAWDLIRETATSQKYFIEIGGPTNLRSMLDVHYTKPEIANVTICIVGSKDYFTDGICDQFFSDLEKIIQRHGAYRIIDYSIAFTDRICDGNYLISK